MRVQARVPEGSMLPIFWIEARARSATKPHKKKKKPAPDDRSGLMRHDNKDSGE